MNLKPRTSVGNDKALLYRRFTSLEKSVNLENVYKTFVDNVYWIFDNVNLNFMTIDSSLIPAYSTVVIVNTNTTILQYKDTYFKYDGEDWVKITELTGTYTLLSAKYNNIAKYQTNKYYFVGSFDYMIKGSIEGTTTQYLKGNIMPLSSMNIKYFDDEINIHKDDLVVAMDRLWSVENPETIQKRMPKPYNVYYATLNSIL